MRIPPLVVSMLLLANAAFAQGIEYRLKMHMSMPGMSEDAMPTPETTVYMKGGKIRVDNNTRGMAMSMIIDPGTRRLHLLNHNDKSYREEKGPDQAKLPTDTAKMRAMGMIPEVIPTTEKRSILGYDTKRVVMVMRVPNPSEPGSNMLSINESWITTDPKLKEAFKSNVDAAERMLGPAAQDLRALMPPGADGIPLETNMLMLKRAPEDKVDALALLKDPNPEGLISRVRMETLNFKFGDIPDSMFVVPADYKKSN